MNNDNQKVLGYIQLETGEKLITPMNDVFINYTFQDKENWEELRKLANIIYLAYLEKNGNTKIRPSDGEIEVSTQFSYFKDPKSTTPKSQDAKMESTDRIDFIEFQNKMNPTPPIPVRGGEYLGFALSRGGDKQKTSMWLLNGAVPELLNGKIFANYILMDEEDHSRYPIETDLLFVDLKKLAEMDTQAGELARVLLDLETDPKDEEVKSILKSLKRSFNKFKVDTEVCKIMTREETLIVESIAETEARLLPLIDKQKQEISEKEKQIAEDKKRIAELEAMLVNARKQ